MCAGKPNTTNGNCHFAHAATVLMRCMATCVLIRALWARTLKRSHAGLYTHIHTHAPHAFIQIDSAAAPPCEVACRITRCMRFTCVQDEIRASCSIR
eukprot:8394498-Alexandrium_andersonii.AAC.1